MTDNVRAIYEHGTLRLLDPVALNEGQQTLISILPERELVRLALKDILVPRPVNGADDENIDKETLQAEIDAELRDQPPLSDLITGERAESP